MDGLLQFEPTGHLPFRSPTPYQHTNPRVLLLSPFAIPNHFTVVVFEEGLVSVSIARNKNQIRTTLAECGFEVVDAPPQRMYPFNQRKAWKTHMTPRVLSERFPEGTVVGGVDRPMEIQIDCPACGGSHQFTFHDIEARWYSATASRKTPLGWHQFDAARPIAEDETPLDMTCAHCTRPMRVVVRADEWRMSLWLFYVTEVLALAPDTATD
jgi:hypothetical protein